MKKMKNRDSLLTFTQLSILLSIEIIVCFTPLGTLPALGPLSATLSHIPVIITAVLMGEKAGAFMGLAFGACSFIYWSFVAPGVFSFIYTPLFSGGVFKGNFFSIVICFLPRILIGPVTGWIIRLMKKAKCNEGVSAFIGGIAGSLTNTVLVLSGICIFFGEQYLSATGNAGKALLSILSLTVLTNGLPEAALGGMAACFIARPVKKIIAKLR